jgi:hypothetical protein
VVKDEPKKVSVADGPTPVAPTQPPVTEVPSAPVAPVPVVVPPVATTAPQPTSMDVDDGPLAHLAHPRGGTPAYDPPDRFVHPDQHFRAPKNQVKYGPGEGLSPEDQALAYEKVYGQAPGGQALKGSVVFKRLSQYDDSHGAYLEHAHRTGRPLTVQEQAAQDSGDNVTGASINHVIASGVGQNTLNQSLASFSRGEAAMPSGEALGGALGSEGGRRGVAKSLAQQAAAVGRVQMYNRAIALENHKGLGAADAGAAPVVAARNEHLQQTVELMEQGGLGRYKSLLADTFDSPGNLRVGHGGVNGVVSTGLDVELTSGNQPTPRSERLQEAHLAAAPDHDTDIWTTFTDATEVPAADRGAALSSSREASAQPAPAPSFVKRPPKGKRKREDD